MQISVVVPCYNEEAVIDESHSVLYETMKSNFDDFEIIYINDGSKDHTRDLLNKISTSFTEVRTIHFSRNFGHQPAVTAGIKFATGDYIIIIDADLQDPPSLIPQMVEMARSENANVVYGVRKFRDGETWFKKQTAKMYYRLMNHLSETKFPLDTGDFRLIDRKIADVFNRMDEKHKYIRGIISWIGFKQLPIYYHRAERFAGDSHYPFSKMMQFAMRGLLYFSKKPLTLATNIGIGLVGLTLISLVAQFVKWYLHPESMIIGWMSIFTAIVFFGGVQLLTIGILGSYIGNIFDEVKNRPEYIVDEIVGQ